MEKTMTVLGNPDPAAMMRELFAKGGGLDVEKGNAYIAEVYEDRKHWGGANDLTRNPRSRR